MYTIKANIFSPDTCSYYAPYIRRKDALLREYPLPSTNIYSWKYQTEIIATLYQNRPDTTYNNNNFEGLQDWEVEWNKNAFPDA